MSETRKQILITNDDGIGSPGLYTLAVALSELGEVWITAPRDQASGTGRSMPSVSDGIIKKGVAPYMGRNWNIYSVGGTPAQVVQHAILEIMPSKPDIVVSGINYGLNLASGITISGTVGAAIEGASFGIPSVAVSLETPPNFHLSHSEEIDFSESANFTKLFCKKLLNKEIDNSVCLYNINIPDNVTANTAWKITKQSPKKFYYTTKPQRSSWEEPGFPGYARRDNYASFNKNSDVYTVIVDRKISITPLSLDMTAKTDFDKLASQLSK
jgi:5'-nucleotidase